MDLGVHCRICMC